MQLGMHEARRAHVAQRLEAADHACDEVETGEEDARASEGEARRRVDAPDAKVDERHHWIGAVVACIANVAVARLVDARAVEGAVVRARCQLAVVR